MASLSVETPNTNLLILSPAIPLAVAANWFGFGEVWVFFLSLLGLALLTERVNFLVEQVTYCTGPTVSGLLNVMFGNAPEIIIAIFALYNQMIDMIKYFLLGSIVSNLLLVLGASLCYGSIIKLKKLQKYEKRQAIVNSYLLLLALLCYLLPILFRNNVGAPAAQPKDLSLPLSIAGSITILIVYLGNLVFELRKAYNQSSESINGPREIKLWNVIMRLVAMIVFTTLLSRYVVETIEGASNTWVHVNLLSVLLSAVRNAARHNRAITSTFTNKQLDISFSVALGSATQIFTFVVPLCTIIAWLMGNKMDLNFNFLGTAFLTFTIVATVFPLLGWLPSFPPDRGFNLSLDFSFSFNLRFIDGVRFLDGVSFITDYFTNN